MGILPECEGLTLIFVETKRSADALEIWLQKESINATSIHGDRTQSERERALQMFRHGRCPVLVATSVAARGLDIPNVMHVINYDMPNNIDDYVHRIGRTGRCGNTGTAIAFINEKNRNVLRDLFENMKETSQKIEPWFESMAKQAGFSSGRRKDKRGFGGRDFRRDGRGGDRRGNRNDYGRNGGGGGGTWNRNNRGGGGQSSRDHNSSGKYGDSW